jgi:hypothetical protein
MEHCFIQFLECNLHWHQTTRCFIILQCMRCKHKSLLTFLSSLLIIGKLRKMYCAYSNTFHKLKIGMFNHHLTWSLHHQQFIFQPILIFCNTPKHLQLFKLKNFNIYSSLKAMLTSIKWNLFHQILN